MTPAEHVQRFVSEWSFVPPLEAPAMVEFKAGLRKMLAFAMREAREEMRERAAKVAVQDAEGTITLWDVEHAIRALPID